MNKLCERILQDRESCLREHYDKVLTEELLKQHNKCVQFATKQVQQQFSEKKVPSCELYFYVPFIIELMNWEKRISASSG